LIFKKVKNQERSTGYGYRSKAVRKLAAEARSGEIPSSGLSGPNTMVSGS